MNTIGKINQNIDEYEINTNRKINEIESSCKVEIQSLQDTVNVINKSSIQSECINNKFILIEQSIIRC